MTPVTLAGVQCTNMYRDVTCHHDRRSEWQAGRGAVCYDYWGQITLPNSRRMYVCVIIKKVRES